MVGSAPMHAFLLLVSLLLLLARPASAQELVAFDVEEFGGVRALRGELYQPVGSGPFGAVILLHDCDGPSEHHRTWAKRLQDWGYVALLIDTFGYRRITEVQPAAQPLRRDLGARCEGRARLPADADLRDRKSVV